MSPNGGSSSNWYDPANYAAYDMNTNNATKHYGLLVSDYWRAPENYLFAVDGRLYVDGTLPNDTHNPYFIVRGDGNVGIGTTSPSAPLYVSQSTAATNTTVVVDNTNVAGGYGADITLQNSVRKWALSAGGGGNGEDFERIFSGSSMKMFLLGVFTSIILATSASARRTRRRHWT